MTHEERVYDTDLHFIVDPVTRTVHNKSGKVTIIQYDHNSERITFEVPRYIDSHDMAECNRVEVHYNNIATGKTNRGLYEVTDLQVSPDDSRYVICSWLISQNATRLVGRLAFVVRFSCSRSEGVEEGLYDYSWNTAPYGDISIVAGINNAEELVYEYPDILMQWKNDLVEAGVIESIEQTKTSTEDSGINELTVNMVDGTQYPFIVRNGSTGPRGYSAYEIAVQNGYEGTEAEWNAAVNEARVAAETAAENAETTAEEIRQYLEDVTENTWESSDDFSWKESSMPSHSTWQAITYGNGMFVAIASDSNKTAYSTDGENWTETTNLPSSAEWYSVTYGSGKFVAVAYGTKAAYSTDGINWTGITLPVSKNWRSVAYGNDMFVALAGSSNTFAYSKSGIAWSEVTIPSGTSWYDITFGNGIFVAISNGTGEVMRSTDGVNWTVGTLPSVTRWRAIAYGNGLFVTVAYNTDVAAYSTDGLHWTNVTLPSKNYWCDIVYGNGMFMVPTYNSIASIYSIDGVHWSPLELPSKTYGYAIAYGNGRFVAIGWDSDKAVYAETDEVFASRVDYDEISKVIEQNLLNAPDIVMIDKTLVSMSADQDKGTVVTSDGVMIVNAADDNTQGVNMTSNAFTFLGNKNGLITGLGAPTANDHAANKEYVDNKSYLKTETWTFTLEDGSTVTKVVYVG